MRPAHVQTCSTALLLNLSPHTYLQIFSASPQNYISALIFTAVHTNVLLSCLSSPHSLWFLLCACKTSQGSSEFMEPICDGGFMTWVVNNVIILLWLFTTCELVMRLKDRSVAYHLPLVQLQTSAVYVFENKTATLVFFCQFGVCGLSSQFFYGLFSTAEVADPEENRHGVQSIGSLRAPNWSVWTEV